MRPITMSVSQWRRISRCFPVLLLLALCGAVRTSSDADDDELLERLLSRQQLPARKESVAGTKQSPGATKSAYRKGSVDENSLRTQAMFQKEQRERIRVAHRDGKPEEAYMLVNETTIEPLEWLIPCELGFYQEAYGVIEGCTPQTEHSCRRIVRDGFATPSECQQLVEATEAAMHNLFHRGGTTSLAPAHKQSQDRLGMRGSSLFKYLINKVRLQVMDDYNLASLCDSGALLTRLIGDPPRDEWDVDPDHVYWNAHVDKANIATYDYSALLYLNDFGSDFQGGEFEFIDDDANRIVQPKAGRLVTFTSGPENLHRVRQVVSGTRHVLAMWFTCSAAHQYVEEDEEGEAAAELRKEVMSLRALNQDLMRSNQDLLRAVDALAKERSALLAIASPDKAARRHPAALPAQQPKGWDAGEDQGAQQRSMLEDMAVKRRLSAEVELAKKRLRAAKQRGQKDRGGGAREPDASLDAAAASGADRAASASSSSSSSESSSSWRSRASQRCFDVESCAAEWRGEALAAQEGGWAV